MNWGRLAERGAIWGGFFLVLLMLAMDANGARGHDGLIVSGQAIWGRDFANVWSGGGMLLDGSWPAIYDVETYQQWQRDHLDPGLGFHNYSYPPTSLFYAWPFALVDYRAALVAWWLGSMILFYAAARPWLRDAGIKPITAIILPASALCLWAGHYGLFFGALWLWAWRVLANAPVRAGLATGLMIIKPHLALLMPVLLAARRQYRAFLTAALVVITLVAASILLFGNQLWSDYLGSTSMLQSAMIDDSSKFYTRMMPSSVVTLLAMGAPPAIAWSVHIVIAWAAIAILFLRRRSLPELGLLASIATFLILPYSLGYDMTAASLAALLHCHWGRQQGDRWAIATGAAVLILPPAMIMFSYVGIRPGALLLLALLLSAGLRSGSAFAGITDQPQSRPHLA